MYRKQLPISKALIQAVQNRTTDARGFVPAGTKLYDGYRSLWYPIYKTELPIPKALVWHVQNDTYDTKGFVMIYTKPDHGYRRL